MNIDKKKIIDKIIKEYSEELGTKMETKTNRHGNISINEPCSICYDIIDNDICITPCDHIFHTECVKKWLDIQEGNGQLQTCPLCRNELQGILDDMSKEDRDSYLAYSRDIGMTIQYHKHLINQAANIIERLTTTTTTTMNGSSFNMDLTGFADNFNESITDAINQGDDIFGLYTGQRNKYYNLFSRGLCSFITTVIRNKRSHIF
jgi:hypothetical protein